MNFYVYQHRRLDDDSIFYIGKGSKNRAWSKHNRNHYWHNITSTVKYIVEIIFYNLSEEKSLEIEKELIKSINPVANFTKGGDGGDTFSLLPKDRRSELIDKARKRAQEENSGVKVAAKLRKGKTKENDQGLKRTSENHKIRFKGINNPMSGKSHWNSKTTEEQQLIKNKTSETLKQTYKLNPRKYEIITCPFCNKSGGKPNMTRYHFNNCKVKQ